ncbi:MAG: FtsX-like permease family protein, partial [Bacteroidota bacterium]|nr:FtsX-like permease family protein [Bacteroidota bacterium]
PKVTAAQAENTMRTLVSKYNPGSESKNVRPILQPLSQVYLYGEYAHGKPVGGRIDYLRLFTLVAVFTLLIACVNFMNLSTARSAARSREVGVRKVIGAGRFALFKQFMGESLIMAFLSLFLALLITTLALPSVNSFTQKQLTLNLAQPALWVSLLGLALFTGLIAGSYPALFLSSLQPVRVLKGTLKTGVNAFRLRQALVVFQFVLSVFLIVGMLVVGQQINYLRTTRLGLDRENVFYVPIEGNLATKRKIFRQELLRADAIRAVATTGELPINIGSNTSGNLIWPGKDPKQTETVWQMTVGTDFIKTMGITLLSGRDFNQSPGDSLNILVNESAAKLMGLKDPVGQPITFMGQKGRIIGLMKDFHLASLHVPIQPLVIRHISDWTNYVLIKTQPGRTVEAIQVTGKIARQLNPAFPFDYHFLDEDYEKLYRNEMLINSIVKAFGLVAILISCLGLFGLVTYTAEQRTKEIGIRKVLGASVTNIVTLLSSEFLKLVLLANILAWPLAWWAVHQWLQNFAYRAPISWKLFALAGTAAVLIALITVSFQAIKAAVANPVKTLRNE